MTTLLERFDREARRAPSSDPSVRVEIDQTIMRIVGLDDRGWSAVGWSDLDESTADGAIAREVEYFDALGHSFEWKYYDYDLPRDLERRLLGAGFRADDDESVMVGELATIPRSMPPNGVRIEEATDTVGVDRLVAVHEAVFGHSQPRFRAQLLHRLENAPGSQVLVLAMAGEQVVSAARAEFPKAGAFASLWGGGTLPAWRGRGIYRALVSYRADLAAARGYRYLHVDASSDSRPILERLGFIRLARTTPYIHEPVVS